MTKKKAVLIQNNEDIVNLMDEVQYRKIAAECKADDFIQKPFDLDHMIEVVKKNSD